MKTMFEAMGGTYRQEGDYLLPNVEVPKSPAIGIWGQRRHKYLMEHNGALYTALFLSGKQIRQGRYTDAVDELLIKLQKARRCRQG